MHKTSPLCKIVSVPAAGLARVACRAEFMRPNKPSQYRRCNAVLCDDVASCREGTASDLQILALYYQAGAGKTLRGWTNDGLARGALLHQLQTDTPQIGGREPFRAKRIRDLPTTAGRFGGKNSIDRH